MAAIDEIAAEEGRPTVSGRFTHNQEFCQWEVDRLDLLVDYAWSRFGTGCPPKAFPAFHEDIGAMGVRWVFINDDGTPDDERQSCLYTIGGTDKFDPDYDILCPEAKRKWWVCPAANAEIAAAIVATILNPKHATWEHDTEPIYDFLVELIGDSEEAE